MSTVRSFLGGSVLPLLALLIVLLLCRGIKEKKCFLRVFLAGLVIITFECCSIFICALNGEYFQINALDGGLKTYFAWLNPYLVFILGGMVMLFGLIGLWSQLIDWGIDQINTKKLSPKIRQN